jgi:chromosome segregation and condensation protein ScpB
MNPSPEVSLERDDSRLPPRIEAVVLASPEPVTVRDLARALRADELEVQLAIDGLNADYMPDRNTAFSCATCVVATRSPPSPN